jgi:hypothetical protein
MQEVTNATDKLWREIMDKVMLFIACCVFSFITGMYTAHMIDKDRGCTVKFSHGNETHVLTGRK